ncbi:hypothetical protein D3C81_2107610 [compost metagenome]
MEAGKEAAAYESISDAEFGSEKVNKKVFLLLRIIISLQLPYKFFENIQPVLSLNVKNAAYIQLTGSKRRLTCWFKVNTSSLVI